MNHPLNCRLLTARSRWNTVRELVQESRASKLQQGVKPKPTFAAAAEAFKKAGQDRAAKLETARKRWETPRIDAEEKLEPKWRWKIEFHLSSA